MKSVLEVKPGESIGLIHLGMSRQEVYAVLGQPVKSGALEWVGDYHIEFEDDQVLFIEIPDILSKDYYVLFKNISLFTTEASLLIEVLSKYGVCKDEDNGYSYDFPSLQLALWRSDVFTYDMITSEEVFIRGEENMEDDMRGLYFETICVYKVGYYDQ